MKTKSINVRLPEHLYSFVTGYGNITEVTVMALERLYQLEKDMLKMRLRREEK